LIRLEISYLIQIKVLVKYLEKLGLKVQIILSASSNAIRLKLQTLLEKKLNLRNLNIIIKMLNKILGSYVLKLKFLWSGLNKHVIVKNRYCYNELNITNQNYNFLIITRILKQKVKAKIEFIHINFIINLQKEY